MKIDSGTAETRSQTMLAPTSASSHVRLSKPETPALIAKATNVSPPATTTF